MPEQMEEQLNRMEKMQIREGTVYKPSTPSWGTVISNEDMTPDSDEDWYHTVIDITGIDYAYLEGQSMGVLAPGEDAKGKPHRVRLYSIASAQKGDDGKGTTASLSTRRLVEVNPDTGETYYGVCSNYICDLKPGEKVKITGPAGKAFVLPADRTTDLILFATGTGVAPFRAFLNYLFLENSDYTGRCIMFYGVKRAHDLAYMNSTNNDIGQLAEHENFQVVEALSRENPDQKVYVQHRLLEHKEAVWDIMKKGNFGLYICGIKGMEKGIDESFRAIAEEKGADWDELKARYKKEGRWNQEVY